MRKKLIFHWKNYLSDQYGIIQKIAQKIGAHEVTIEIGIGDLFSNGDRDRDRDRDFNLGDRANALLSYVRARMRVHIQCLFQTFYLFDFSSEKR